MTLAEAVEVVARLDLPEGDYAVHGSGPLLAWGLLDEVNDLDIVSRGAAWEKALQLAPARRARKDDVVSPEPGVEIFDGWLDDDANALIDGASVVNGLRCVSLAAVLDFKRRLGRPKDRQHIRLIDGFLRSRRK